MALARSASVPGGLSINTGAANLFATSQAPSGGLFGQPAAATTTAAPAASSLFGGGGGSTTTTMAQQPAGGLFGGGQGQSALSQSTAAPATGGGLFGQTATTAAPATGGGLFGQTATTAAPATGGGLFGQKTTAAPATGGGLFGQTTTAAPATGGGLFGQASTAAPATTAPATGGGLFGQSTAAATTTGTGGGLFGQQSQPQQQQQQQQQQGGQAVPGVRIDVSNLKGTTRFNDLHESLQKDVLAFDLLVQAYVEQKNQVEAFLPAHGESLDAIPHDVRFVARKYDGAAAALATDLQAVQGLRETVRQDADHAQLSFKALDNQKLPAQFHTSGLWVGDGAKPKPTTSAGGDGATADDAAARTDLISYFSQTGDGIGAQLRRLERNLGEIEVHMHSVQAGLVEQLQRVSSGGGPGASAVGGSQESGGGSSSHDKVAELAAVLRDFEESILGVASVVGSAREDMTALQLNGFLGRGR